MGSSFLALATPVLALTDSLPRRLAQTTGPDAPAWQGMLDAVLADLGQALERFGADARDAGKTENAVGAARFALTCVIETAARRAPGLDGMAWAAAARGTIYAGRAPETALLTRALSVAEGTGPARDADLAALLRVCLRLAGAEAEAPSAATKSPTAPMKGGEHGGAALREPPEPHPTASPPTPARRRISLRTIGLVVAIGAAIAGGTAAMLGYQQAGEAAAQLTLSTAAPIQQIRTAATPGAAVDAAGALEAQLQARVAAVRTGLAAVVGAGRINAASMAAQAAMATALKPRLAEAASAQGPGEDLDHRIVADLLAGRVPPDAAWLAGFMGTLPGHSIDADTLSALATAVLAAPALDTTAGSEGEAPTVGPVVTEAALLLAISRDPVMSAAGYWSLSARLPDAPRAFVQRSGAGVEGAPRIPALFTAPGAALLAEDPEALTRAAEDRLMRLGVAASGARGVTPDRLAATRAAETRKRWRALVATLRARPFVDPGTAADVTSVLGAPSSPLDGLLAALRDHLPDPIGTDTPDPAFTALLRFAESDGPDRLRRLFATLNVALTALDRDPGTAIARLTAARAETEAMLAAFRAPGSTAPLLIGEMLQDTVLQASVATLSELKNRLDKAWAEGPFAACTAVLGRYPFGSGEPVPLVDLSALFGPGGTVDRFSREALQGLARPSPEGMNWTPEALSVGAEPSSLAFLAAATSLRERFFTSPAPEPTVPMALSLVARSPEILTARLALGGAEHDLLAEGDLSITWPGPNPEDGVRLLLETEEGPADWHWPGGWGFFRMLDDARLRERDEGRRRLGDLSLGALRLVFSLNLGRPDNVLAILPELSEIRCDETP